VATFLPLLALLLVFCGREVGNEPPGNSFQLNDQSVKLDQCLILFDSSTEPFKFEINLVSGSVDKNYDFKDTTKVKQSIWLSLIPKQKCWLTDGEYKFSSSSTDLSPWMSFVGTARIGGKKVDITGGNLICKQDSGKINITFNLEVDKKNKIKGSYSGLYNKITRMPISGAMTSETKTQIVSAVPSLSIVFRIDGNYINDKLFSAQDFIAKVKEWQKANPEQRGLLSYRTDPGVELSDIRNREISAISNATGMLFAFSIGVDQQAVFPGGNDKMFAWIEQNIRYPKGTVAYLARRDVVVNFEVNTSGKVINPIIKESVNPEMDAEALRVVSQMPTWKTAFKNGVPVSIDISIGIPFKHQ
jgi:TonB family protein